MPVAAQRLWDWHARPGALASLIPPWESVTIQSWRSAQGQEQPGLLEDGVTIVLVPRLGPLSLRWISRLQDVQSGREFSDIQLRGPFSYWLHRHRFVPETETTSTLIDEVSYRLPLGPPGQLVAGPYIRKRLERMFDYRHRVTLESLRTV